MGDPTIFFDVDDTLVLWDMEDDPDAIEFRCYGQTHRLVPHKKHIEILKRHKEDGYKIIVWSAGGEAWARTIVDTLDLGDYVDYTISKPDWFYDDSPPRYFMHKHRWLFDTYKGSNKISKYAKDDPDENNQDD